MCVGNISYLHIFLKQIDLLRWLRCIVGCYKNVNRHFLGDLEHTAVEINFSTVDKPSDGTDEPLESFHIGMARHPVQMQVVRVLIVAPLVLQHGPQDAVARR